MKATKKKKPARRREKWQQSRHPADRLLLAVGKYVESHGGSAIVVGPIGLIPGRADALGGRHQLVVDFMGRLPKPPSTTRKGRT